METSRDEQKLKNLLRLVAQQGASDLHLVVGRHPMLRIDGKLLPIAQEKVLTPDDTKKFSNVLIGSEDKKKDLLEKGHTDFSYNLENKARFRKGFFRDIPLNKN